MRVPTQLQILLSNNMLRLLKKKKTFLRDSLCSLIEASIAKNVLKSITECVHTHISILVLLTFRMRLG